MASVKRKTQEQMMSETRRQRVEQALQETKVLHDKYAVRYRTFDAEQEKHRVSRVAEYAAHIAKLESMLENN